MALSNKACQAYFGIASTALILLILFEYWFQYEINTQPILIISMPLWLT